MATTAELDSAEALAAISTITTDFDLQDETRPVYISVNGDRVTTINKGEDPHTHHTQVNVHRNGRECVLTLDLMSNICRICFSNTDLNDIFESSYKGVRLSRMLQRHIGHGKVRRDDKLPQKVCIMCVKRLGQLDKFIDECRVSDEVLRASLIAMGEKIDLVPDQTESLMTKYNCAPKGVPTAGEKGGRPRKQPETIPKAEVESVESISNFLLDEGPHLQQETMVLEQGSMDEPITFMTVPGSNELVQLDAPREDIETTTIPNIGKLRTNSIPTIVRKSVGNRVTDESVHRAEQDTIATANMIKELLGTNTNRLDQEHEVPAEQDKTSPSEMVVVESEYDDKKQMVGQAPAVFTPSQYATRNHAKKRNRGDAFETTKSAKNVISTRDTDSNERTVTIKQEAINTDYDGATQIEDDLNAKAEFLALNNLARRMHPLRPSIQLDPPRVRRCNGKIKYVKRPNKCEVCEMAFESKELLVQHILVKHQSLNCDICDSSVHGQKRLKLHFLRQHALTDHYVCAACKTIFGEKQNYVSHRKSKKCKVTVYS